MSVTTAFRTKLAAMLSASKKYLIAQETMSVFPSMQSFARVLEATIELCHTIDPEEKGTLGALVAIGLLRLALNAIGNITMFYKKWFRG